MEFIYKTSPSGHKFTANELELLEKIDDSPFQLGEFNNLGELHQRLKNGGGVTLSDDIPSYSYSYLITNEQRKSILAELDKEISRKKTEIEELHWRWEEAHKSFRNKEVEKIDKEMSSCCRAKKELENTRSGFSRAQTQSGGKTYLVKPQKGMEKVVVCGRYYSNPDQVELYHKLISSEELLAVVYVHEMIHAYLRLNYNNDVGFNDWIRKIEEPIVESTMLKFFEDFDNEEILELAKEHVKRKQYSLGIEFYGFGYYIYQNAKVIECLEQYRKTKPRLSRSIPDVENYLNFWSSGAYPRNQESECLEVLWDAIGRKINPKRILEKLKEKKNRGVLPSYLSLLSNEIDFGQYLSACPSINTSRSSYLNSLRKHEFQDLLDKHYLPLDLYSCQNLYGLVEVLDKLVYHPKTPEVAAALNYGGCSCRYALCYYIKHLLYINHITV